MSLPVDKRFPVMLDPVKVFFCEGIEAGDLACPLAGVVRRAVEVAVT